MGRGSQAPSSKRRLCSRTSGSTGPRGKGEPRPQLGAGSLSRIAVSLRLAEVMVRTGVPFREAHRRVGALLRRLEAEGIAFEALSPDDWTELGLPEARALFDPDRAVRARAIPGGPSPRSVLQQVEALERLLAARA